MTELLQNAAASELDPGLVERARAFVAEVDSAIARHGFSIRVRYDGADPRLAICRAEDQRDVLVAETDDWKPVAE